MQATIRFIGGLSGLARPAEWTYIHDFRPVITGAAKHLDASEGLSIGSPFSAGTSHDVVAGGAPGVWSWVTGIIGPPEPIWDAFAQTSDDVLADEGLVLKTVFAALHGAPFRTHDSGSG